MPGTEEQLADYYEARRTMELAKYELAHERTKWLAWAGGTTLGIAGLVSSLYAAIEIHGAWAFAVSGSVVWLIWMSYLYTDHVGGEWSRAHRKWFEAKLDFEEAGVKLTDAERKF